MRLCNKGQQSGLRVKSPYNGVRLRSPKSLRHVSGQPGPRGTEIRVVLEQAQEAGSEACLFEYGMKAEQGLRDGMEDTIEVHWDAQRRHLFTGCYDGHGGPAAALWLESQLQGCVENILKEKGVSKEALGDSFQAADSLLLQHLEHLGGEEQATAGSTATVALISEARILTANVGDSQAFVLRKGNLVPLTTPHRVYGSGPEVATETARIKSTGGWVYDGRVCNILAVSRAFGDWEFKGAGLKRLLEGGVEKGYWPATFAAAQHFKSDPVIVTPAISETALTKDDEFLVLSTDGLWDVMPPREVMQWARKELLKGLRPKEVAESLVDLALKRHTSDNTSVIVVDLKGTEYWTDKKGKGGGGGGGGFLAGLFKR